MKTLNIVNGPQNVSAVIQGCMRMPGLTKEDAAKVIRTAYDCGINFFDHATCYGENGAAETKFAEAFPLTGLKREDIYIQSKIDNPDFPELNKTLGELAEREKVSKAAIAIAWILRHPAKMQAIIGTMNPEHIRDICASSSVSLSHHDWYALYLSAGKYFP